MNLESISEGLRQAMHGISVRSIEPLRGGMSASIFRADIDGGPYERIVIRFPSAFSRELLDNAVDYEFATLAALSRARLPVPTPICKGICHEGEFFAMEFLSGRATAKPADPVSYVDQMAEALALIHQTDLKPFDFLLENKKHFTPRESALNLELREDEVNAALKRLGPWQDKSQSLRHGDFWPGNLVWQKGTLTGIIDWEAALRGPAMADLGVSRLDVWWVLGRNACKSLTDRYLEITQADATSLVYWDLRAALRPMSNFEEWAGPYAALDRPDITPETMKVVLLEFIEDALSRVP